MQEKIITLYCLCVEFLAAYGYQDDPQAQMSTAEVMTTALVAATFFTGNQELSRVFLKEHGYIPKMLSKSRLNRRLHALPDTLWQALWYVVSVCAQASNPDQTYVVDSCPLPCCDNIRIRRCRLYQGDKWRGYCASKRRYFYGLRIHLLITAFRTLPLDLPPTAEVYADPAYTEYVVEDFLQEHAGITLTAQRKKNSTRPLPGWVRYLCDHTCKWVETTFSQIAERFARSIHAVTPRGFELKAFLSVLAFAIVG